MLLKKYCVVILKRMIILQVFLSTEEKYFRDVGIGAFLKWKCSSDFLPHLYILYFSALLL